MLPRLFDIFVQELNIRASFYLTEENFASQRFLYEGLLQLEELLKMKKEGVFDFETALLREENNPSSIIGFIMIEREKSDSSNEADLGNCLVFTPILSDLETKKMFQFFLSELNPDGKTIEISKEMLADDVREYYSNMNLSYFKESSQNLPPYDSVYSAARTKKAVQTLKTVQNNIAVISSKIPFLAPDSNVLEICCGNGMSTLSLYEAGIAPICLDINEEEICIGLAHGVLKPEKTIIMDATTLSQNLDESFDTVIGFMIGTIYEFDKNIWFSIVDESLKVLKKNGFLMLTLRKKQEAEWILEHLNESGISAEIIDNQDNQTNYDSWICLAQK